MKKWLYGSRIRDGAKKSQILIPPPPSFPAHVLARRKCVTIPKVKVGGELGGSGECSERFPTVLWGEPVRRMETLWSKGRRSFPASKVYTTMCVKYDIMLIYLGSNRVHDQPGSVTFWFSSIWIQPFDLRFSNIWKFFYEIAVPVPTLEKFRLMFRILIRTDQDHIQLKKFFWTDSCHFNVTSRIRSRNRNAFRSH